MCAVKPKWEWAGQADRGGSALKHVPQQAIQQEYYSRTTGGDAVFEVRGIRLGSSAGLSRQTIAGKWIGDLSRDGPLARAGKLAAQWTRSMSGSFQVLSKKARCGP